MTEEKAFYYCEHGTQNLGNIREIEDFMLNPKYGMNNTRDI